MLKLEIKRVESGIVGAEALESLEVVECVGVHDTMSCDAEGNEDRGAISDLGSDFFVLVDFGLAALME